MACSSKLPGLHASKFHQTQGRGIKRGVGTYDGAATVGWGGVKLRGTVL